MSYNLRDQLESRVAALRESAERIFADFPGRVQPGHVVIRVDTDDVFDALGVEREEAAEHTRFTDGQRMLCRHGWINGVLISGPAHEMRPDAPKLKDWRLLVKDTEKPA